MGVLTVLFPLVQLPYDVNIKSNQRPSPIRVLYSTNITGNSKVLLFLLVLLSEISLHFLSGKQSLERLEVRVNLSKDGPKYSINLTGIPTFPHPKTKKI